MAVASAGPYANCLHLAPDRYPHQHLVAQFLQTRCSSWCLTNSVKALKAIRIVFFACLFQCHVNGILILLCLLFFLDTGAAVVTDTVWNSQLAAPILLVGKTSTVVLLFWNQPTGQYNSCTVCVRLLLHCVTVFDLRALALLVGRIQMVVSCKNRLVNTAQVEECVGQTRNMPCWNSARLTYMYLWQSSPCRF